MRGKVARAGLVFAHPGWVTDAGAVRVVPESVDCSRVPSDEVSRRIGCPEESVAPSAATPGNAEAVTPEPICVLAGPEPRPTGT